MLEDQVAYLLQRYLGNYARGLNKEALKISVWQGDVELTNMQLKPEALNALKLPVKVKARFLGSVKLKVPWSRLGQDPVVVYLDSIFLLVEPATQVQGSTEDAIQEAKKSRVREMEMKLVEKAQQLRSEVNQSWLGSLINTIVGNLKLSISNIHIRYEDSESNPGHPFAAGVTLEKLLAVTVDDNGNETFIIGGSLDHIQKYVELDRLALYLDSDIIPWHIDKPWEDLLPSEWVQVFRYGTKEGKPADRIVKQHTYILEPITGNGKYTKLRANELAKNDQPLQNATVNLDDIILCLSKDGYKDMLKLADHFSAFNQRLKYAHFRPHVSVKSDPRSWWTYAYRAVSDQVKKGRLNQKIVLCILCLGKELYIDTASHVFVVFASTANYQGIHLFPRKLTTRRKRNLRRWKIRCLDGLHDFDTCIAKNEEAIQIDPNFAECYGNMANAWKEKGNIDVAIRYYLIAIEAVCFYLMGIGGSFHAQETAVSG